MDIRRLFQRYWPILPAFGIFSWLAYSLNLTQDDAYITYRYAANFLNGDGLVFNIGERVEGFTNFGWTVYMILLGSLGLDFIALSKLTGFLFGGGVIVLTFLIARRLFGDDGIHYSLVAVLLVGANQALSYWSPAGLETAAFSFFALWSFYLYLKRSWLLIFALVMAVWIRPEGAIVTGILILVETIQHRKLPRFTLYSALVAFILSLPMVGFKLAYYGSILPNPFFAKTSFSFDQLLTGLDYAGGFFKYYTFYYAGILILLALLILILIRKRWSSGEGALWFFTMVYVLYIVLIGGDVLYVHRFFLPLIGPIAILMVLLFRLVLIQLRRIVQLAVLIPVAVAMLVLTYWLPLDNVSMYNVREKAFTYKMQFKANQMKQSDTSNFSVAVGTIGIFGYELLGHDIIDMLGLTDSTIARYSEDPIPGMETTWKEKNHNSKYILERAPDYILFSTGIKPSAPAERALLLYRQFLDSYRSIGWFFARPGSKRGLVSSAFKKVRPIKGEIVPVYKDKVAWVDHYKRALDAHSKSDHKRALVLYDSAGMILGPPYYANLIYQKAFSLQMLKQNERAFKMLNDLVAKDSLIFEAHMDLYRWTAWHEDAAKTVILVRWLLEGSPWYCSPIDSTVYVTWRENAAKMAIHKRWLLELAPWYWPRIDSTVDVMLKQRR